MKASSLFRRNLSHYALEILAIVVVMSLTGLLLVNRIYRETLENSLVSAAQAASSLATPKFFSKEDSAMTGGTLSPAQVFAQALTRDSGYRCTLIRSDGSVAAEANGTYKNAQGNSGAASPSGAQANSDSASAPDKGSAIPSSMENHGDRPEVASALKGIRATSWRFSSTLRAEFLYAAIPVRDGASIAGVVRFALLVPYLESRLAPTYWLLALAALAATVIALAAARIATRRMARPIEELAAQAARMASSPWGRPEVFLPRNWREPAEIMALAAALTRMAAELSARMAAAKKQSQEFAAILESMKDAVFALDAELAITMANKAAAELTGASDRPIVGRNLLEALRSGDLYALTSECRDTGERKSGVYALYTSGERWYRAHAAPLPSGVPGTSGSSDPFPKQGVVLALSDITEMRRLEKVRKEFVANVSHELRTPIQLIQGFSETLIAEKPDEPEQERHFLEIIRRNAERMGSIVDDLLSLARLEQDAGSWLALAHVRVWEIVGAAVEAVEAVYETAVGMKPSITRSVAENLVAVVNAGLVEQALLNLLDNAVKYSPPGSRIHISAEAWEGMAVFRVKDSGPGIPPRDLSHIFERFYRVDKARSRTSGGTGLGLAIVRHIALIHGGTVSVSSELGHGSTFMFSIPIAGPPGTAGTSASTRAEDRVQPRMP